MLINMKIDEFGTLLASKEPAPGGGSAAALSGMLGASLALMVVNLTVGKKAFDTLDDKIKKEINEAGQKLEMLKAELSGLIDEDTQAFNAFMSALKLPKITDEEKEIRAREMLAAQEWTISVPLKTCEKCLEVLETGVVLAEYGNKNAVSDMGVSALMAMSGLEGASLNVRINLPGIADGSRREALISQVESFISKSSNIKEKIMNIVMRRMD